MIVDDLKSEDSSSYSGSSKQEAKSQQDRSVTYNILSDDEEKSAAKEIKTGKKIINVFSINDKSNNIGIPLQTDPADHQSKLCAGNLALDDERGMEGTFNTLNFKLSGPFSNQAEGEYNESDDFENEEFKGINIMDKRVKVTKKRRSESVRDIPRHKRNLRKMKNEMREVHQKLEDIYFVESYKEYNRALTYQCEN